MASMSPATSLCSRLGSASAEWLLPKAQRGTPNSRFSSLGSQSGRRQQESFPESPAKLSLRLLLRIGDLAISESMTGTEEQNW